MKKLKKIITLSNKTLAKAEQLYGSATALAEKIGVSKQVFSYWRSGKTLLPYEKAIEIFIITNGKISLYDLRSDLASLTKDFAEYHNKL
jgi:DNA-binding transcriptional regulator YdaS (Cro superfamily)